MEPVGKVFQLKISPNDLRAQLVPSFASVLEDWVNGIIRTPFSDPSYVLDITYITQPLATFLKNVVDGLNDYIVIGSPLERGFGFGKTHSLILLWHIFTSDIYKRISIEEGIEDLVKEVLVLGIDCTTNNPLSKIIEELQAYANPRHPVLRLKDGLLIKAISGVLNEYRLRSLSSSDLAMLIAKIMERYRNLGGRPRLLLLIDELGWGLSQRLRKYVEKVRIGEKADDIYVEADSLLNFLSLLYAELEKIKPLGGVVIWVIAEQDRKELETLAAKYQDQPAIYEKIKSLLKDLDNISERYSRGLAGRSLCEIYYSYEHSIEIARYRVLRVVEGVNEVKAREKFTEWLKDMSERLNLGEVFRYYESEIKRYYPFSIGLLTFLKKLMNPQDIPATEFVRTVISIVAEASQKALSRDPEGSYTIGVRHLGIDDIVQSRLMREVGSEWVGIAGDIKLALDKIEEDKREPAELAVKYLLAKGVTADLGLLLELRDQKDLKRYGSTVHEFQLETLETFVGGKAFEILEKLSKAIDLLTTESARIDVVEFGGERYYLPSILKTVYNKLVSYINEERRRIENEPLIPTYIFDTGFIQSLFSSVNVIVDGRQGDVIVEFTSYNKVKNLDAMLSSDVAKEAQNAGKLLLLLVLPWDADLFNEMYVAGRSYREIVEEVGKILQNAVAQGRIRRPLHIVLLVPDLSRVKLRRILDKLTVYIGTKKFLSYLSKKENIIKERLQELEKLESALIKRDLTSIINEEMRRKHLQLIESRLEREIAEAKNLAQKQLVRLSRDIVLDILELYHSIVYYSLDENKFTQKEIISSDTVKTLESREEDFTKFDLSHYASMVNTFFRFIIKELAYEHDIMRIQKELLNTYRREFEKGITRRQDKIKDVLENLMLGAYGVKPLSIDVAREALKYLNNQVIELDEIFVTITVDDSADLIKFDVKPKTRVESEREEVVIEAKGVSEIESVSAPLGAVESTVQQILLELPEGFNVDDFSQRILAFINILKELDARLSAVKLELETPKLSLSSTLKNLDVDVLSESKIRTLINFMSRVSRDEKVKILAEINISRPIAEDNVKKVFGDYYKRRLARFERLLPT